jgi:hypothetical protein
MFVCSKPPTAIATCTIVLRTLQAALTAAPTPSAMSAAAAASMLSDRAAQAAGHFVRAAKLETGESHKLVAAFC